MAKPTTQVQQPEIACICGNRLRLPISSRYIICNGCLAIIRVCTKPVVPTKTQEV